MVNLRLQEGAAYRRSAFHVLRQGFGEVDEQIEGFLYQNLMGLVPGVRWNPLKMPGDLMEGASFVEVDVPLTQAWLPWPKHI